MPLCPVEARRTQGAGVYRDRHCRETLDRPMPAPGGKSPRQAIRTHAGRKKLLDWRTHLDNGSAGRADGPITDCACGWMWDEHGLAGYRR